MVRASDPGNSTAPAAELRETLRRLTGRMADVLGSGSLLRVATSPDLHPLLIEEAAVEALLLDLARAARDAMPRGGILDVAVSPRHTANPAPGGPREGLYVAFVFSDAGLGLPPEAVAAITSGDDLPAPSEPTWVTSVVERLRSVRRRARACGGELELESGLGYGARTTLLLPTRRADVQSGK